MPMRVQRVGGAVSSNHSQPDTSRKFVFSTTLLQLIPCIRRGTQITGDWMSFGGQSG